VLGESFHGAVLIGIGLNCNQPEFPGEIAARAVSLRQLLGREVELPAVLQRILAHLHAELADPHWRTRLEERLYLRGRRVRVLEDAEAPPGGAGRLAARQGRLVGLADDGALLLQPDSGTGGEARAPVRVYAGELQELPELPR
jgi:biotin-(acetyl-CoA carboxylase) ligase